MFGLGFFDLGVLLLQPPANPTSNSCGVHKEALHRSPARHQPCVCCSRPPTSSHGGRGGFSNPVTSGRGVQRGAGGARTAATTPILPSPLVIPTCRSALPSYPLKDKHGRVLSGAARPPAPSLGARPPRPLPEEGAGRGPQEERPALAVPVSEGAGEAHGGRGQAGAAQGAAAGGAERRRPAAEDGGAAVPQPQHGARLGGRLHGPAAALPLSGARGPARPGRRPRPRLFPRGPAEPGRRRR